VIGFHFPLFVNSIINKNNEANKPPLSELLTYAENLKFTIDINEIIKIV